MPPATDRRPAAPGRHRRRAPAPAAALAALLTAAAAPLPAQQPAQQPAQPPGGGEPPRGEAARTGQDPAPVQLSHALAVGAEFHWSLTVDARLEFDDRDDDTSMRFVLHFAARVKSVDQGRAAVPHRLTRIEARTHSPFVDTEYDSANPGADPGSFRQLAELVDKSFTVHVDPLGYIDRIDLPADMPRGAVPVTGADFDSLFELYFVPLPPQAVAVGDSWTSRVKLVEAGIATGDRARVTNTLESVVDGRATIARQFHLRAPRRPGVEFEIVTSAGKAVVDVARGRVVETVMELVAKARHATGGGKTTHGTSTVVVTVRG